MPVNKISITGKLTFSNYEIAPITLGIHSPTVVLANGLSTTFDLEIQNGNLTFVINDSLEHLNDDDCRRVISESLETIVLTGALRNGFGFRLVIDKFIRHDGRELKPQNDNIQLPNGSAGEQEIFGLIGSCFPLRVAIRDFNSGLIDRENCPIHFYRALDTVVRMFTDKSESADNLKNSDWDYTRERLGINFDNNHVLIRLSKKHRHSIRDAFDFKEHLEMMRLTKEILVKTCDELERNPISRRGAPIVATLPMANGADS